MRKLILPMLRTMLIGVVVLGVLLFLPAWTLNYWQAWVFIVVFTISTNALGIYLSLKDPELLKRRLNVGPAAEQSRVQKIIVSFFIIGFLGLLVFCGFDHRFGWSPASPYVAVAGDALVVLGLLITYYVLKENSYSGSTVQIFEGQKVITTGPYALVRHPMYTGALIMTIGIPLALGSWWGLAIIVLIMPLMIWRILDEEKLLEQELPRYTEYEQKVRYRLAPYLW